MLDWITDWVRQLIVIVVLSGFAELALPDGSTRGYVRVVTGLLVMLVVLGPVLQVFGEQVAWTGEPDLSIKLPEAAPAGPPEVGAVPELQRQTERLKLEMYRQRLCSEIKRLLSRVGGIEVVRVSVDVEPRSDHAEYGAVLAVGVLIRPTQTPSGITRVRPVDVNSAQKEAHGSEGSSPGVGEARRRIYDLLQLHFGVPADRVEVKLVTE